MLAGAGAFRGAIAILGSAAPLGYCASAGSIPPNSTAGGTPSRATGRRGVVMGGVLPPQGGGGGDGRQDDGGSDAGHGRVPPLEGVCGRSGAVGAGGLLRQAVPELDVEVDLVQVVGVVDRLEVLGRPRGPAVQAGQQSRHAFLV